MSSRERQHTAFTFFELMVVVMIIALIAAIAYPYVVRATEDADENARHEQLALLRRQIKLYQAQHGGALPDLISGWQALTQPSVYNGRKVGPYLNEIPRNHKRSNVLDGKKDTALASETGFVYDYRGGSGTGGIWVTNGSGKKLRDW